MSAPRTSFTEWLEQHSKAIQAAAGILTVLLALAALVGVKVQIDASRQLQQEQSARDIYREFLNLSIGRPELAVPDACTPMTPTVQVAYDHYVDYMLYTTEQLIEASLDWEATALDHFEPHAARLCAMRDFETYPDAVATLVQRFQVDSCPAARPACPSGTAKPAPAAPAASPAP